MRDLVADIDRWLGEGKKVAMATVVKTWGSAPRPLGSKMAISDAGDVAGSVSGGCVEGAVIEEARAVLSDGVPRLLAFGVQEEEAWAVGLSCGGQIEVYVDLYAEPYRHLAEALAEERLVALATVVEGPAALRGRQLLMWPDGAVRGELQELSAALEVPAREAFASFQSQRFELDRRGETLDVFLEVHPPRPKLVIVGAVHVAIPLVSFAKTLGFRTYVVDPRTAFATPERFGHADEVLTDWPDEALARIGLNESTYLALLSHDPKLDLPALKVALPSPARYVGALGSKKTHQKRLKALTEEGVPEELQARIHNPIGLDLGGRRAEEMAVAILGEIVAVSHGRGVKLAA